MKDEQEWHIWLILHPSAFILIFTCRVTMTSGERGSGHGHAEPWTWHPAMTHHCVISPLIDGFQWQPVCVRRGLCGLGDESAEGVEESATVAAIDGEKTEELIWNTARSTT